MLGELAHLQLLHLQKQFARLPLDDFAGELLEIRRGLKPNLEEGLRDHARILGELLAKEGCHDEGPLLRELACLVPGASRGRPGTLQRIWFEPDGRPSRHLTEAADAWKRAVAAVGEIRALPEADIALLREGAAFEAPDRHDALGVLRALDQVRARIHPKDLDEQMVAAYRALSPEDGRRLAEDALRRFDRGTPAAAESAELVFTCLACFVPDSLSAAHVPLAERALFWPPHLYRNAGGLCRDLLLTKLDAGGGEDAVHIAEALAWIGDDAVQAAFARWRTRRPPWAASLRMAPEALSETAGWELSPDGSRRDLITGSCARLIRPPDEQLGASGPVRAVANAEERCGWCSGNLVALFDLDLSSLSLRSLGLAGTRLRVPICERCTTAHATFADIDFHGGLRWSALNEARAPQPQGEPLELPRLQLALGATRRTGLEALAFGHFVLEEGASQLGGFPMWLQGAEYPVCPKCRRSMPFLGQLDAQDLDAGEGLYYAFVCSGCGVAATTYQQT